MEITFILFSLNNLFSRFLYLISLAKRIDSLCFVWKKFQVFQFLTHRLILTFQF